jgi:hypothetical protein
MTANLQNLTHTTRCTPILDRPVSGLPALPVLGRVLCR